MKNRSLTFKFTLMFAAFTIITLVISSLLSYANQTNLYKQQREESIRYVASYLEDVLTSDGEDFAWWQEYFLKNYKDLNIPHDFGPKEIQQARHKYEKLFSQNYPGIIPGIDIAFSELPKEIKTAYTIYKHEYYLYKFEQACKRFNLAYVEYIIPDVNTGRIMYALDAMRDEKIINGEKYIELGISVPHSPEEHKTEWEAWNSGIQPSGYDSFDNEYGKTYAYYMPLYIGTKKLGLIGVEVFISAVNKEILRATIRQMLMISGVLTLFMVFLLFLIRLRYIRKLIRLQHAIDEYSKSKKTEIAEQLLSDVTNKDEISTIMAKFAEMIFKLETYMKFLVKTRQDLQDTQKKVQEMSEDAVKDSLTGIRNKNGYDREVKHVEWEMSDGLQEIGLALIDLNSLKKINDTYGYDKGNEALISLCQIVCDTFDHSPVFRIDGDEFAAILKGHDFKHVDELVSKFKRQVKKAQGNQDLEDWKKISATIAYALFDPQIDTTFENIFKRAVEEMSKSKKTIKAPAKD
ncbi:GGDEF domain-containing protein [Treponema ruminis]|uniref:diguanylate cyclase n=1 Tax=Treponema ruminis TaxID=744515 RepID=A0A7W8G789_9SPIR|nr:GGDEF domain-containing protein [Treponema ruminis]MBB5225129.1 diguanylate cyclase (GGDEF)-like protein [Treponema ruminis]QSI01050.1 GGDEF domain-containing protein [Treponema ruminis]